MFLYATAALEFLIVPLFVVCKVCIPFDDNLISTCRDELPPEFVNLRPEKLSVPYNCTTFCYDHNFYHLINNYDAIAVSH